MEQLKLNFAGVHSKEIFRILGIMGMTHYETYSDLQNGIETTDYIPCDKFVCSGVNVLRIKDTAITGIVIDLNTSELVFLSTSYYGVILNKNEMKLILTYLIDLDIVKVVR
jgi:hypothetical protein